MLGVGRLAGHPIANQNSNLRRFALDTRHPPLFQLGRLVGRLWDGSTEQNFPANQALGPAGEASVKKQI